MNALAEAGVPAGLRIFKLGLNAPPAGHRDAGCPTALTHTCSANRRKPKSLRDFYIIRMSIGTLEIIHLIVPW